MSKLRGQLYSFHPKTKTSQAERRALFVSSCAFVSESWCSYSQCFRLHIRFYMHHFHSSCSSLALTANISFSPSPDLSHSSLSLFLTPASASRLTELSVIMYAASGLICRETTDLIHPWKGISDFENSLCRDASTTPRWMHFEDHTASVCHIV